MTQVRVPSSASVAGGFGRVGEVTITLLECQRRAHHLGWALHSPRRDVQGEEHLPPDPTPDSEGTAEHWVWRFRTHGPMRLLGPPVGVAGRRLERRVWADMKRYLDNRSRMAPERATRPSTTPSKRGRRTRS